MLVSCRTQLKTQITVADRRGGDAAEDFCINLGSGSSDFLLRKEVHDIKDEANVEANNCMLYVVHEHGVNRVPLVQKYCRQEKGKGVINVQSMTGTDGMCGRGGIRRSPKLKGLRTLGVDSFPKTCSNAETIGKVVLWWCCAGIHDKNTKVKLPWSLHEDGA